LTFNAVNLIPGSKSPT